MRRFTQTEARSIAKKLGADIRQKKRHEMVIIRYRGCFVAQYGISRSSEEVNGSYIPKQLGISRYQAGGLVECWLSKDGYFELLHDEGKLPKHHVT